MVQITLKTTPGGFVMEQELQTVQCNKTKLEVWKEAKGS